MSVVIHGIVTDLEEVALLLLLIINYRELKTEK